MGNLDKKIIVQTILSGKLRRYHHLSVMRQLLLPSLVLKNIRDSLLVAIGFTQSFIKLIIWRPSVVFAKGGYVCLPVGFAAHLLKIPLVIHDSDAHPGLTNTILSKWAKQIATGAPLSNYSYPTNKTHYVGVPISSEYYKRAEKGQYELKKQWGVNVSSPLIVVTGGGLGAKNINDTVAVMLDELLSLGSVVLISGELQYDELRSITPKNSDKFQLHPFVSSGMAGLLRAADVVVARAGATTILELAALAKPTILIPNAKLTGGHQLKNAAVYQKAHAVMVVDEDTMLTNPKILVSAISDMLSDKEYAYKMAQKFKTFARPNAARDVANLVISSVK